MKLIVGLGNPGRKYLGTRHNVGFEVVTELARRHGVGRSKEKFKGQVCEARIGEEPAWLLLPETFMNVSGSSVQPAVAFLKLEPLDLLIVCDDFHLPLAKLRFRPRGSAGGQKGLADILARMGTHEIPRLRVGVGEPPPRWDVADYVLSRFRQDEVEAMEGAIQRAADGAADWARHGMDFCMNLYNATLDS